MNYREINAETIDRWIEEGWEWGKPIDHETFVRAAKGEWDVVLTPTKPVPHEWFGSVKGKKILGLASGGGTADADLCGARSGLHRIGLFRQAIGKRADGSGAGRIFDSNHSGGHDAAASVR